MLCTAIKMPTLEGPAVLPSPEPAPVMIDPARETNHRLANSLQLLSAMVAMTARDVTDRSARQALAETSRRIQAFGRLHQHLYTAPQDGDCDLSDYLLDLAEGLEESYGDEGHRRVIVDAAPILVTPDQALAVGVLVTELVVNACKYAYAPDEAGDIRILVQPLGATGFELVVEDCGIGRGASPAVRGTGLGSRLIDAMATRLNARHGWQSGHPGTRFHLVVA